MSVASSRSFGPSFVALWWFYFLSFVAGFLLFPVVPLHLRALSALYFAFDAGIALGSLGLGWVMQASGFRWGWGLGALMVLPAILLSLRLKAQTGTPG